MVSIRKAKQGYQVRRRGQDMGPSTIMPSFQDMDKERLGILVLVGLCVGMFFLFGLLASPSLDPSLSKEGGGRLSGILRKPHPNLMIENEEDGIDNKKKKNDLLSKNVDTTTTTGGGGNNGGRRHRANDGQNAMALDILKTLDCETVMNLNPTKPYQSMSGGGGEEMGQKTADGGEKSEQDPRRRLSTDYGGRRQLQQHADDGLDYSPFQDKKKADSQAAKANNNNNNKDAAGQYEIPERDDDFANKPRNNGQQQQQQQKQSWGREAAKNHHDGNKNMGNSNADDMMHFDDAYGRDGGGYNPDSYLYRSWRGRHLFCLAAMENPPEEIVKQYKCDASGLKRRTLLDLWTSARAQITNVELLKKILDLAQEKSLQQIYDRSYSLWAPPLDSGMTYVMNTLKNEQKDILDSLQTSLTGDDTKKKLFVDVGSGLGLTTLAVAQKYPTAKIVSIEPASPNWLLQELNLRCNLSKNELHNIKVIMAGVGPNDDEEDNMVAKLMWRPTSTSSTRSWTPATEFGKDDIELIVRLQKLKNILAQVDVDVSRTTSTPHMMDVLNLDCQGCEYNLIPTLTEDEFDSIPNVIGGVHWGYIPITKLPSSTRGKQTHERLCQHENIAKTTKECCSFLNSPVKSSQPGEVLYRDKGEDNHYQPNEVVTVSDIIQEGLCTDYEQWSIDHHVHDIQDDFGWFEISSQA